MQSIGKPKLFHCVRVCEKCGRTEDCVYNFSRDKWCCAGCAIRLASSFSDYGWVSVGDSSAGSRRPSRFPSG